MAMPFRRQDIAKAFFDLDLSNIQPPSADSNRPTPSCRDPQVTLPLPTTNEIKPKSALLALPAEIRLQIYDLLLVSRFKREENPSWAVGNTCQKLVLLHMIQAPQYRTMEPAILRTCMQIYREAISVLYSENVFNLSEPEQMFRFMAQIGPTNLKLVKLLDMWIPWMADIFPWLTLLNDLSKEAAGLEYIELGWGAKCEVPWMLERGAKERGLGDNLLFVRALAKIQGLEKIHMKGYYAKNWPSYLKTETSAHVLAECGHYVEPGAADDSGTIKWKQELNESNLRSLMEYQKGTEDLVP
jgi:hypothetical protein